MATRHTLKKEIFTPCKKTEKHSNLVISDTFQKQCAVTLKGHFRGELVIFLQGWDAGSQLATLPFFAQMDTWDWNVSDDTVPHWGLPLLPVFFQSDRPKYFLSSGMFLRSEHSGGRQCYQSPTFSMHCDSALHLSFWCEKSVCTDTILHKEWFCLQRCYVSQRLAGKRISCWPNSGKITPRGKLPMLPLPGATLGRGVVRCFYSFLILWFPHRKRSNDFVSVVSPQVSSLRHKLKAGNQALMTKIANVLAHKCQFSLSPFVPLPSLSSFSLWPTCGSTEYF